MTEDADLITDAEALAGLILLDDGMPIEKAGLMLAAMRRGGHEPIATAEHVVLLRQAARGVTPPGLGNADE